jgi:putative ABC transport system permease protein
VTVAVPWAYSVRSVAVRKGSSAMAVGGIALVVLVFVFLLALGEGFARAVATSGSPDNLILLRKGADAELQSQVARGTGRIVEQLPIVSRDGEGRPEFLFESVVVVAQPRRDGGKANMTVRGTAPDAFRVHEGVRIARGRWFRPGAGEAAVGAALARRLAECEIGRSLEAGGRPWTIVGVFEADGSGLESEMWVDGELFQAAFKRGPVYSSLLFRAAGAGAECLVRLKAILDHDPRLRALQAMTEKEYYVKQAQLMSTLITVLGTILTLVMAVGGVVGAMNTMYAAISQRQREIGCLLALGFTPFQIWRVFVLESLVLASLGAVLGCLLSLPFHGMRTGTTNWATFAETAFRFEITPAILVTASTLGVGMGFVGGFLPALRGARMKVVDALRRG